MSKIGILAALALVACGGASSPAPQAAATTPAEHGEHNEGKSEHGAHEHQFPAEVTAFHDVMAPLWHAEAGDARRQGTCDAVAKMSEAARSVEAAQVPAKAAADPSKWHEATAALTLSVEQLGASCAATAPSFEADFKNVHEKFHALVALIGHHEKG